MEGSWLAGLAPYVLGAILGAAMRTPLEHAFAKIVGWRRMRRLQYVLPLGRENQSVELLIRPSLEVMSSGRKGASKRGYTHAAEVEALTLLLRKTLGTPFKINFRYGEVSTEAREDWIIFGLSRHRSDISDGLLAEVDGRFGIKIVKDDTEFEFAHQYFQTAAATFRCEHAKDEQHHSKVTIDYGLIARLKMIGGNYVLLCGGIHMFGSQAALEVALDPEFIDRVRQASASEFAQLVKVGVKSDGLFIDRSSIQWKTLPFATGA